MFFWKSSMANKHRVRIALHLLPSISRSLMWPSSCTLLRLCCHIRHESRLSQQDEARRVVNRQNSRQAPKKFQRKPNYTLQKTAMKMIADQYLLHCSQGTWRQAQTIPGQRPRIVKHRPYIWLKGSCATFCLICLALRLVNSQTN